MEKIDKLCKYESNINVDNISHEMYAHRSVVTCVWLLLSIRLMVHVVHLPVYFLCVCVRWDPPSSIHIYQIFSLIIPCNLKGWIVCFKTNTEIISMNWCVEEAHVLFTQLKQLVQYNSNINSTWDLNFLFRKLAMHFWITAIYHYEMGEMVS